MDKASLRRRYKEKRLMLTAPQKEKLEDLMLIRFQQLRLVIPPKILTYAPMEKLKEFDPGHVTDYCLFKNPGQVLYYPRVSATGHNLEIVRINEETVFTKSAFGVDEPEGEPEATAEILDMVIVPLLCFDNAGFRVGYGKGYYDKFLETCRKDALKIGFSFFEPENAITGLEYHDVQLDYCITPEQAYSFTQNQQF